MIFSDINFLRDLLKQAVQSRGWVPYHPSLWLNTQLFFTDPKDPRGEMRIAICGHIVLIRILASDGLWFDDSYEIDLSHPDSLNRLDAVLDECSKSCIN